MERRERRRSRGFDRVGQALLGREIGAAKERETVDEQHLLVGRPADQAPVFKLGGRERSSQAGFAAGHSRNSALDEQARRDEPGPGGDAIDPG